MVADLLCARPRRRGGEATESAWLATVVVELDGNADAVPVIEPILPDDLEATWKVDYACRLRAVPTVKECQADIFGLQTNDKGHAALDCRLTSTSEWVSTDASTTTAGRSKWIVTPGAERDGTDRALSSTSGWVTQTGAPTNVYTLDDGRKVVVYCTDPRNSRSILSRRVDGATFTAQPATTCDTGTAVWVSYTYDSSLFTGQ